MGQPSLIIFGYGFCGTMGDCIFSPKVRDIRAFERAI